MDVKIKFSNDGEPGLDLVNPIIYVEDKQKENNTVITFLKFNNKPNH